MPAARIPADAITGVVLAGGAGRRVGGVDKGLLPYRGRALVQHAIDRLAPQVGALMVSANRHLSEYEGFGHPVWPDTHDGFAGPLAGWSAALSHCTTAYLVSVPCDAPHFPLDLVERLATALAQADVEVATAATIDLDGSPRLQPVFSLLSRDVAARLRRALATGERRVGGWASQQRQVVVTFDDSAAFANLNTPADLA